MFVIRLTVNAEAPDWHQYAECGKIGAPGMFPTAEDGAGIEAAKRTCLDCPVQSECLSEAMDRGERFGIWGGLTTEERRNLHRRENRPSRTNAA